MLLDVVARSRERGESPRLAGPKRVLVIGGKQKVLQKAKALGLDVLYIQKKSLFDGSHLAYADHTVVTDYEDLSVLLPIARALHEALPFGVALSLTEPGLLPAAHVNHDLGLRTNPLDTVRLLKDKWAMRRHLNEMALSPVESSLGHDVADVHAFVRDHGYPIIVKPVDASGSLGITPIREPADIETAAQRLQELGLPRFLMEEYLEGREISVEAFSFAGHHVILAMTDKMTLPNYVECGHSIPAQLDAALRHDVAALVHTFLDAVGLRDGPSHTELKLTPRGPRIVESHNRIGGDKINELVQLVTGVDMDTLALAWPFGLAEPVLEPPPLQGGAAVRFFTPPPGIVRSISGDEQVRGCEHVVELELDVAVGNRVPPVRYSLDRSGHVVTRGPDVQTAVATCDQVMSQVHILTEEVPA